MSKDNVKAKYSLSVKLFYNYLGSYKWLSDELFMKRYDAFKYLVPISKGEKYNVIVKIYKDKNNSTKDIFITCEYIYKFLGLISSKKTVLDKQCIPEEKISWLYSYLKKTYFEK